MSVNTAETVYLNNAAGSWPKAPGVADAVKEGLLLPPYHPGRSTRTVDPARECRDILASMMGMDDSNNLALTCSATHSLNLAILGMSFSSRSRVITTAMEHNSVLRPLHRLKEKSIIRLDVIGLDEDGSPSVEEFERAVDSDVALVVMSHVSNVTGKVVDVARYFGRARGAGAVTLLDASQSMGHLDVRPEDLHCDMVAFTGHKGLLAPPGTGGLYVAPHIELQQIIVGGTGVRSDSLRHAPEMPMRLEAGTPNVPAFMGFAAALRWLRDNRDEFRSRERSAYHSLRCGMEGIDGIRLFGMGQGGYSSIVSFALRGWDVEETGQVLQESFDIICRTGLHCAPLVHEAIGSAPHGTVRFSVSGFTTEEDIQRSISALKRIAA
jgi:cysteine desulfurase family protein